MSSRDLGCFAAGAVAGGILALALNKERTLSGKVLIIRDGSVVATTNSTFEDDDEEQRWGEKAVSVEIFKGQHSAGQFTGFKRVIFVIHNTASGERFRLTARNRAKFEFPWWKTKLRVEKGKRKFKFDGREFVLCDGAECTNLDLTEIVVVPDSGPESSFPAPAHTKLSACFRSPVED
jgi:hypothetical protein